MDHSTTVNRVRKQLGDAARRGKLVVYEELLDDPAYGVSDDQDKKNYLGTVLGEISQSEVLEGRPPLSAICVRKAGGIPGPEFRRFMDPAGQMNDKQLKAVWQYMRDAVFKSWEKRKETVQPLEAEEE